MYCQWFKRVSLGIFLALLLAAMPAYAVKNLKVSNYGGGNQVWFEAEDYDERNPDTDEFFVVVDADGAFGQVVTREGGAGGMMRWSFDISAAGGAGGTWYFWGRVINPSNQSDYLLVEGDPDDVIPTGPPFPGGNGTDPFVNDDDRIFEEDTGPPFDWARASHDEGHTKELQDGVNTMYMFHRQGNNTRLMDVFMWTDNPDYVPTDDDYRGAQQATPVEPAGKLATAWGKIKSVR